MTGKRPEQETDQTHLTKFLTSINNVEISREICRWGIPIGTTLQDLFLKVTGKEAGQQLAEGVALAHSAQIMEIQDTNPEVNELGGQTKMGHRGFQCWSCGGYDHLQRDCKAGNEDSVDQTDGPDRKVGHIRNTLVTESDVTSSMMGDMYQQLATQMKGKIYKTGYRQAKLVSREAQGSMAMQTSIMTTDQINTTVIGSPGPPIPGTPQLRTPPRPTQVVTTVGRTLIPTQTTGVTTVALPIPQMPLININCIQDKTPQATVTVKQEPMGMVTTAPAQKVAVATRRRGRPRNQPVATCQILDAIEEVNEDSQMYSDPDFGETESEAADLCEILENNSDLNIDEPMIDFTGDQT